MGSYILSLIFSFRLQNSLFILLILLILILILYYKLSNYAINQRKKSSLWGVASIYTFFYLLFAANFISMPNFLLIDPQIIDLNLSETESSDRTITLALTNIGCEQNGMKIDTEGINKSWIEFSLEGDRLNSADLGLIRNRETKFIIVHLKIPKLSAGEYRGRIILSARPQVCTNVLEIPLILKIPT